MGHILTHRISEFLASQAKPDLKTSGKSMSEITSKVALVTGSATGIGRACALRFAKNKFDVVVNYSRSEAEARETLKLVEACGVRGLLVKCDVGIDAGVRDMLHAVESE